MQNAELLVGSRYWCKWCFLMLVRDKEDANDRVDIGRQRFAERYAAEVERRVSEVGRATTLAEVRVHLLESGVEQNPGPEEKKGVEPVAATAVASPVTTAAQAAGPTLDLPPTLPQTQGVVASIGKFFGKRKPVLTAAPVEVERQKKSDKKTQREDHMRQCGKMPWPVWVSKALDIGIYKSVLLRMHPAEGGGVGQQCPCQLCRVFKQKTQGPSPGQGTRQGYNTKVMLESALRTLQEQQGAIDAKEEKIHELSQEKFDHSEEIKKLEDDIRAINTQLAESGVLPYTGERKELPPVKKFSSVQTQEAEAFRDRAAKHRIPFFMTIASAVLSCSKWLDRVYTGAEVANINYRHLPAVLDQRGLPLDERDSVHLPSKLRDADPSLWEVDLEAGGRLVTIIVSAALFYHLKSQFQGQTVSQDLLTAFANRARTINLQDVVTGGRPDVSRVVESTILFYRLWEREGQEIFQYEAVYTLDAALPDGTVLVTPARKLLLTCPGASRGVLPSAFAPWVSIAIGGLCSVIWGLLWSATPSQWWIVMTLALLSVVSLNGLGANLRRLILGAYDDFALSCALGFADTCQFCLSMWTLDLRNGWRIHTILALGAMSSGVFSQITLYSTLMTTGVKVLLRLKPMVSGNTRALSIPDLMPSSATQARSLPRWSDIFSTLRPMLVVILSSMCLLLTVHLFFSHVLAPQQDPSTPVISQLLSHSLALPFSVLSSFSSTVTSLVGSLGPQLTSQATSGLHSLAETAARFEAWRQKSMGVACPEICARVWETDLPTSCSGCSLPTSTVGPLMGWSRVMMVCLFFTIVVVSLRHLLRKSLLHLGFAQN